MDFDCKFQPVPFGFFFGKRPVSVSADYNSKCLPHYCKKRKAKEKIRWQPEHGTKVGKMIKAWRMRYKL